MNEEERQAINRIRRLYKNSLDINKTTVVLTEDTRCLGILLNLVERLQKDFTEVDHECFRLEKVDIEKDLIIDKQNKMIDLMAEYMVNNMDEYQLDDIYSKQYNCNGMERDWCRGDEKEKADIKQYFEKEVIKWKN